MWSQDKTRHALPGARDEEQPLPDARRVLGGSKASFGPKARIAEASGVYGDLSGIYNRQSAPDQAIRRTPAVLRRGTPDTVLVEDPVVMRLAMMHPHLHPAENLSAAEAGALAADLFAEARRRLSEVENPRKE